MSRIVVVSNRVPTPSPRPQAAGGLAVALQDAVADRETLWFGWSGTTSREHASSPVRSVQIRNVTYATIDLDPTDHAGFYQGFANGMLWPLLHGFPSLCSYRRADHEAYNRVNRNFAAALAPLLRDNDLIWVHDYQLFPMGKALRDLGVRAPMGFYLHVPFPSADVFGILPKIDAMVRDLGAYDLIGTQIDSDSTNLNRLLAGFGLAETAHPFPVGIDPAEIAASANRAPRSAQWRKLSASLDDRALILGVDRLDYTKGLPQRFRGYAQLLAEHPEHRNHSTLLQVAPVSRGEVATYRALRRELDELVGRIHGEYADVDWTPLRYMTRTLPRSALAGFYRLARVGLVTPLRDGMNLVAKEYVAAQDPIDPGVLVLSRFAGAAEELHDALIVNPYDPDDICDALHQALVMPMAERRARWERMISTLRVNTASAWASSFIAALETVGPQRDQPT